MTLSPRAFFPLLAWGDFADLYVEETSRLSLVWEGRRLRDVSQGESSGLGLRYVYKGETRYGHADAGRPCTEGLRPAEQAALKRMAQGLRSRWPARRLKAPAGFEFSPVPDPVSVRPETIPTAAKVDMLERADKAARAQKGVSQVTAAYRETVQKLRYMNSRGDVFQEERMYLTLSIQVTASEKGALQTAYEVLGGQGGFELLGRRSPEDMALTAAKRAAGRLRAPAAPLGEMPVVISSQAGGTLIHEAIGHALEADAILEGSSPHFAGKLGKAVANEKVTVLDDPTLTGHRGSFAFDDEGVPSERTVLVENGVLRDYLYDRRSAQRQGRESNGHGRRESYAHKPIPRMSNTFVAPGTDSPEEILKSLKRGLFVTRMGGGQVDTATGDFVFEVEEGFWVEGGKVKHLVRGANLLGNGSEVLKSIDRVGWDMGWSIGTCGKEGQGVPVSDGLPTLRIPKVVVGGGESK